MQRRTKSRHSIGQWCRSIYNREQREILGRDGKRWSKLAAFYFFFYIALGGFFCLCLAVFMSFLPVNQPRYIGEESTLTSRANPLSPGLSFRPRVSSSLHDAHALISISITNGRRRKRSNQDNIAIYTKDLDDFFNDHSSPSSSKNFTMNDPKDCIPNKQYGYSDGKPCILIKINKLVGFIPEVGRTEADKEYAAACTGIANIPVQCLGENPVDQDMLGDVMYYSESGSSNVCGSIETKHFPYTGKDNQNDVYQSPFVWVQFLNLTPHVLISVECRIFGANLFHDKHAQRASIRFQIYLNKNP